MSVFKVVSRMWHSKDQKTYELGETIDLSHVDGFGLARILKTGSVVAVPTERKRKRAAPAPTKEGE